MKRCLSLPRNAGRIASLFGLAPRHGPHLRCSLRGRGKEIIAEVILPAFLTASLVVVWSIAHTRPARADPPEIVLVKPDVQTHLANGGWKYDRYNEMQSLDAGKRMTIADLKGPGIIRSIHITRHPPEEIASRGVVQASLTRRAGGESCR